MGDSDWGETERLIQAFYAAAFDRPWTEFRVEALRRLCEWSGAAAAAWLTRAAAGLRGEFATWPAQAAIPHEAVARLSFASGARERELRPLPADWRGVSPAAGWALAFDVAHRDTGMRSVVCLAFPPQRQPDRPLLRRIVGHLVQAGTLALAQFIRHDDWLQAMGRVSRGAAALVDAAGGIYLASARFHELVAGQHGETDRSRLPFALPRAALEEEHGSFVVGALHFRLAREGGLYLLHARRPHPIDVLSPREQQIARALAAGKTFKSVARECDIAISTVANHASRIYKKLGIYRREELVGLLRKAAAPRASAA
ncbi:LuxR C-terminal-related transcriptional regulator [Fontimonas sp. SYSU GA230001]|uniref:helix-turn-helix transcriptional regulator n=1 Tax=Fontimonas sp. SYSU GA230001 TaxID=3142450 RepID=UPI0032B5ECC1